MIINGREIKFLRTVKATAEIAKICPDKDISNLTVIFSQDFPTSVEAGAKIIHFLNEGYEMNKHVMDRSYKPQPLEVDEILCLDNDTFQLLMESAMKGLNNGAETSVEIEEPKKKEEKEVTD